MELEPKRLFLLRNSVGFGHNTSCFTKIFQVVVFAFIPVIYRSILIWMIPSWKPFTVQLLSWNALHRTAFLKGQSDGLPEQLESPVSMYHYNRVIYFNWCESKQQNDSRTEIKTMHRTLFSRRYDNMRRVVGRGWGMLKTNENTTTRFPIFMWVYFQWLHYIVLLKSN